MAKRKRKYKKKYKGYGLLNLNANLVLWSTIILVGLASWYMKYRRTTVGFFVSPKWIFLDGLASTILSALIIGGVVANIIPKK